MYQILEVRKTVSKVENKEPPKLKNDESKVNKLPLDDPVNNLSTNVDQAKEINRRDAVKESAPLPQLQKIESSVTIPVSIISTSNSVSSAMISSSHTVVVTSTPATICTSRVHENSTLSKIVQILEKKASSNETNLKIAEKTNAVATDASSRLVQKPAPTIKEPSRSNEKENKTQSGTEPSKSNAQVNVSTDGKIELKKKAEDSCPVPSKIPKLANNVDGIAKPHTDICREVKLINSPIMSVNPVSASNITNTITSTPITPVFNYAMSNHKMTAFRKNPICYPQRVSTENRDVRTYKEIPSLQKPSDLPAIIRNPIKTAKTFTRPWNSSTPTTVAAKPTPVTETKAPPKPVKFFKARNTPRFLGNPTSRITPLYQVNPDMKNDSTETAKKVTKNVSVLKIDPKTLCPIVSSASSTPTSSVSSNKKPFPYIPPTSMPKLYPTTTTDYPSVTNSPVYVGNLPTITSSSIASKLPPTSYPYPMNHNSLLTSINPLLYGIYPSYFSGAEAVNGSTALDYMKAMVTFPPPINPLYNPHHKLKHDKNIPKISTKPIPSPPAIQRIPPSNSKTSPGDHSTSTEVKTSMPSGSPNVSNGVYRSKNKKSEMSSFAINNLIPLDEAKNVSHDCSADGVHQVCDQVSCEPKKSQDEKARVPDEKCEEEQNKVEVQTSVSN